MKAKNLLLMLLMSVLPFMAFAQDDWDDIYSTSKSKDNKKKEVNNKVSQKQQTTRPTQVLVVRDNGDVTLETEGNVNVDVDAYNRRGGDVSVYEKGQYAENENADADEYQDYEYTDRIVKFHDPANSVKISSDNEINVYVTNDLYSNYYRNRGSNFNVSFGWGWGNPYYSWYDPWYYGGYWGGWYDPWYYGSSWGWGWNRPWYYGSSWGWGGGWYGGGGWYAGGWYGGHHHHNYYSRPAYYNIAGRSRGASG